MASVASVWALAAFATPTCSAQGVHATNATLPLPLRHQGVCVQLLPVCAFS